MGTTDQHQTINDIVLITAATWCLAGFALAAGQLTLKEIALALTVPAVLWLRVRIPFSRLAVAFLAASFVLTVAALLQPELRGTHRWFTIGSMRLTVTLPLSACLVVFLAFKPRSSIRLAITFAGIATILATKSYGLAAHTAATVLMLAFVYGTKAARVALLALLVCIVLLAGFNQNRARRLHEHYISANTSYQARQIRECLLRIRWFGPSEATEAHLPAWSDDLAFLDLLRKHGLLAGILSMLCHGVIIIRMANTAVYGPPNLRPVGIASTLYYAMGLVGHMAICIGLLPPAGITAPFAGRGACAWAAYMFVVVGAMEPLPRTNRDLTNADVPHLLVKHCTLLLLLVILGAVLLRIVTLTPTQTGSDVPPAAAVSRDHIHPPLAQNLYSRLSGDLRYGTRTQ